MVTLFQRMISVYSGWLERYPLRTRAITTSVLFSLGDLIAQKTFNGNKPFDWKRCGRAGIIGLFVTGPSLYFWFNIGLPKIMSMKALAEYSPFGKALIGTAIDQACFSWWTVSNYLFWVNFLQHFDLKRAIDNVSWNIKPSILAAWSFWPTIIFCNLNFVPLAYRVFSINLASIAWNFYLSYRNQKGIEEKNLQGVVAKKLQEQTIASSHAA